jgi:alpha-tubulin suppressor-like RCC1 family protein
MGVILGCRADGPPGPATRLAFGAVPTSAVAGGNLGPVSVEARDAGGAVASSAIGAVTLTLGPNATGATLTGVTSMPLVDGVATFNNLSIDKTGAGHILVASAVGLIADTSGAVAISPGAPSSLKIATVHEPTVAGTPMPAVIVTFRDDYQNIATQATGLVTIALQSNPNGGTLGGTLSRNAIAGVATFNDLTLTKTGQPYTLGATSGALVAPASDPVIIRPAAATELILDLPGPSTVNAGAAALFGVAMRDQFGNIAMLDSRSITVGFGANPGGSTLKGGTTFFHNSGLFRFIVRPDRPGNGYTLVISSAGLASITTPPFDVQMRFASVSAGGSSASGHTCGVTPENFVYCWGANDAGQLGDGTTTDRWLPAPIAVAVDFTMDHVFAGGRHTCGRRTLDLYLMCWGNNSSGQLGDGTTTTRLSPVLAGTIQTSKASAGDSHTCVIETARVAFCWGLNTSGQLGDGSVISRSSPVPVSLPGGRQFERDISADSIHTCGVTVVGESFCWGSNSRGQSGSDAGTGSTSPVQAPGPAPAVWQQLQTGALNTCGFSNTFTLYCFGANDFGQLGDGTVTSRSAPTPVATFNSMSIGPYHSCAISSEGLWCWGANANGQLGNNGTAQQNSPTLITPPAGVVFKSVSTGRDHTCAVSTDGFAFCWGNNSRGQLGDGTTTSRSVPTRVSPP